MTVLPCRDVLCLHFTQFCGCEKFLEVPIKILESLSGGSDVIWTFINDFG